MFSLSKQLDQISNVALLFSRRNFYLLDDRKTEIQVQKRRFGNDVGPILVPTAQINLLKSPPVLSSDGGRKYISANSYVFCASVDDRILDKNRGFGYDVGW